MSAYLEPDPKGRDVTFLDQYANERWETVLHYMVASSQQAGISADAVRTLLQAGLMSPDESQDHAPVITRSGFQFLLMERSSQVMEIIKPISIRKHGTHFRLWADNFSAKHSMTRKKYKLIFCLNIILLTTYKIFIGFYLLFNQVWYFMLQYLESVSARGMSLVECLSFLFQLSFSQLGKVILKKLYRFFPRFSVLK